MSINSDNSHGVVPEVTCDEEPYIVVPDDMEIHASNETGEDQDVSTAEDREKVLKQTVQSSLRDFMLAKRGHDDSSFDWEDAFAEKVASKVMQKMANTQGTQRQESKGTRL